MGRGYRPHSAEYVLNNLRILIQDYGVTSFSFEDDNISCDRKKWHRILNGIISEQFNIRWITRNGIRADTLDRETMVKMKKAGCQTITIAVESGDERVLREVIRKQQSHKSIRDAIRWAHELQIQQSSFYIIGFPGETISEMRRTLELAREMLECYDSTPGLMFATPIPETFLWHECIEKGIIEDSSSLTPEDWALATDVFGMPIIRQTQDFNIHDLMEMKCEFIRFFWRYKLRQKLGKFDLLHLFSNFAIWMLVSELRRELKQMYS